MIDAPVTSSTDTAPPMAPFRPVLFYTLAFAIAWSAWTPLLLFKFDVVQLPVPFFIVLFVGQSLGAFAPLLSLFVIQRAFKDHGLVSSDWSRRAWVGGYRVSLVGVAPASVRRARGKSERVHVSCYGRSLTPHRQPFSSVKTQPSRGNDLPSGDQYIVPLPGFKNGNPGRVSGSSADCGRDEGGRAHHANTCVRLPAARGRSVRRHMPKPEPTSSRPCAARHLPAFEHPGAAPARA